MGNRDESSFIEQLAQRLDAARRQKPSIDAEAPLDLGELVMRLAREGRMTDIATTARELDWLDAKLCAGVLPLARGSGGMRLFNVVANRGGHDRAILAR